jgi:hypothetical protein
LSSIHREENADVPAAKRDTGKQINKKRQRNQKIRFITTNKLYLYYIDMDVKSRN